ncbi:ParA family protein [Acidobacteria bacterium ACD]|nr:MAG: ParA family protein [Acidobacteriota bacterium]MCE7958363.1 ParA family protein [Acidobacteria bacterium ACB2]MDL1949485.1 ParA family protein [Acidobacteria bacterium ACD]
MKQSTGESTAPGARVLAVANQKGGVGKTTTAISLGAALAILERRVLLVDFDPQGNTTGGLGFDKRDLGLTVYDWILGEAPFEEVARRTELAFLTLVPASRDLVGAEVELVGAELRERRLADRLWAVRDRYDFVLIDCPPSLGLLTVNALVAADGVLVPIQCEYFALEGVSELLSTVDRVREALNPGLKIAGILATMWDERTNLGRQVLNDIRAFFGEQAFETVVPRNVRLGEAPSFGKPIFLYDVKSRGAEAYLAVARELMTRGAVAAPQPGVPPAG